MKSRLELLVEAAKARKVLSASEPSLPETPYLASLFKQQEAAASKQEALEAASHEAEVTYMQAAKLLAASNEAIIEATALPAATPEEVTKGELIYNSKQQEAITSALAGNSFCLIGAAGTGKTTAVRELCKQLVQQDKVPLLQEGTKVLAAATPGIVCCSFTNIAVNNIARNMQGAVACKTIHSLLEFMPVQYEVVDADGNLRTTMRFEPARNKLNTLPSDLKVIVLEESSTIGTELFGLLLAALPDPSNVQFIFLGDLNQLPPIYDSAILGYKLLELPIIELTEVYRQALNNPFLALAHKVKDGIEMCEAVLRSPICNIDAGANGKLTIKPWKKKLDFFDACNLASKFLVNAIDAGEFDPDTDMCLIPFNKNFGTIELNKQVAQHLGDKRKATVFEVIAGFNKYYLAVGDKVFVNKRFGVITKITRNGAYFGKPCQKESTHLNRWGYDTEQQKQQAAKESIGDIDSLLASLEHVEDRKTQASHFIDVQLEGSETPETLVTSSEVNSMLFAYALTVHKAQGSEWRKVYCIFHHSHNVMMCRELLYTAITRARHELLVICEPNHFQRAVATQRIKGNTLAEKAVYFKGKQQQLNAAAELED